MTFRQFFRIVEIRTKVVSVSTLGLALLWTLLVRGRLDPFPAFLMVAASLMVDMGTTAFNSFFDYVRGVDVRDTNRESDKVLLHESVPPALALMIGLALYAGGAVLGLVLAWHCGPLVLGLGMLSFLVGFLYNGGPRPISSTPLGELFAGGFLGGVLFLLVVYTQTGILGGRDVLAALPSTLFIASILTVNNTCDAEGDRKAGRFTLSIAIGPVLSRILIPLLGFLAHGMASVVLMDARIDPDRIVALAPIALAAIVSIRGYLAMDRRGYSHATKGPSMGAISSLFILFTLGYGAAMGIRMLQAL